MLTITQPKFPLGRVVATANALAAIEKKDIHRGLLLHASGDWGDICDEDRAANEEALILGNRLLSVYHFGAKPFWIITEADRSATTVLLPEDY